MSEEYSGSAWHRSLQQNPHGAVHPEASCVHCGVLTRRRAITGVRVVVPHAGENHYAPERVPWCDRCENVASIAMLKVRQGNPAILPAVRAAEAMYLAELLAALVTREAA